MEYCKYHPLKPASYRCLSCDSSYCDHCVDEGDRAEQVVCFVCARNVDSLGAQNSAEPFWRRLKQSFRYPISANAATLIIATTLLAALVSQLPLGPVLALIVSSFFIKYCFNCLESTAMGLLVPPDIRTAYSGGLSILLSLLALFLLLGAIVIISLQLFGPFAAGLIGVSLIAGLPAILILFAMTNNILQALNPIVILRLITAIGLPYGLILGFIMIMWGSVDLINALIGQNFSWISLTLQSVVSNYYTLVIFHIMGYMLFQYQGELGYSAREDNYEQKAVRSQLERTKALIDITLKEGDYAGVARLFSSAVKQYPNEKGLNAQYFAFLCATSNREALALFANDYLNFLKAFNQQPLMVQVHKRVLGLIPEFKIATAEVRMEIARAYRAEQDLIATIKILNGLHKDFPTYHYLPGAYELLASCLDNLPNMAKKARQVRAFSQQLAKRQTSNAPENTLLFATKGMARSPQQARKLQPDVKAVTPRTEEQEDKGYLPPIDYY